MKAKPKNKKNKIRDKVTYPALSNKYMPKVRAEYNDYEYINTLDDETKKWLNKFNDEYLNASFKHDGTDIQDYETYGKDANDRNNSRNRCILGVSRVNRLLDNYHNLSQTDIDK